MPLKVHKFEVYLADADNPASDADPICHEVRVLHIDQLMGEVAFTRLGLSPEHGMNLTNAWCYAACQRLGYYPKDRPYALFRQECLGLQAVQDPETGAPADIAVDPTRQGQPGDSA